MANLRGSVTTPDGRRAWGVVGSISAEEHGMSVRLCVIASSRMAAVAAARDAGVEGVRVDVDRVPPPDAVLAAQDAPDGAAWQDWFGQGAWESLASLPRD